MHLFNTYNRCVRIHLLCDTFLLDLFGKHTEKELNKRTTYVENANSV